MNKLLLSSAALLPFSLMQSPAQNNNQQNQRPNLIYIMADDLGIGDLGCYGQQLIKTPGIDALAESGLIFNNHYSGSTVSAPSRCVLMTGKHTGHSYIRGNKGFPAPSLKTHFDYPLADGEVTVAEIFKKAGYETACIGKWGLGGPETEGHPNNQGFDVFFGYLGQGRAHRYYPDYLWDNQERVMLDKKVYSHDLIMDKALEFIENNADEPFFLYLTPTIPHADLVVPEGELGEYDGMFEETPYVNRNKDGKGYRSEPKPRATFAAMVSRLDRDVSRVMKLLEEKGIADNTIVIFTSDNGTHVEGGHDPNFFDSNSIYRGTKRDLYDGGIHTPFVVSWPAVIAPGSETDHVSAFWDFLPTICDLIGEKKPKGIDGISYLPTLTGKGRQHKHDYLYYEFHERGGRKAVLKDGWKLIQLNVNEPEKTRFELYNINIDPSEQNNVIDANPKMAAKLMKIMEKSRTENPNWNFTPDAH